MNYGKAAVRKSARRLDLKRTKIAKRAWVIVWAVVLACVVAVIAAGISAGVGIIKGAIDTAPEIAEIDVIPTGYSTTILASDGTEIATLVAEGSNRQYVTLDDIPLCLQEAVIAIEDERFYEHNGIDLKSIARAFVSGVSNGFNFDQGGSTITQQLIKNNVLTDEWEAENSGQSSLLAKFRRKFQEQYLAIELEKQVNDKGWILENYLNSINLGNNTLGVQAAAQRYFGKDVSELSLSEATVIAGITKNPYAYNPISFPENNAERRQLVLDAMKKQGYITQEEYDEALADDVYSRISEHNEVIDTTSVNTYFVDAVIDDVYNDLVNIKGYTASDAYKAIYQGGLTIVSTQDLAIQEICDEEVANPDNYEVNTKYSFFLTFSVKKADGTTKNYTHQTMLAYYKDVNNNSNYSINYESEEACYAAIEEYENDMLEEGDEIVEGSESIFITPQPQVAMTIMDQTTGEVRAIVGGRGEKVGNRTWNRATYTTRQPGSTFKIIACYAPALDAGGLTLASTQDDAAGFTVGTKTYSNYDSTYRGFTSLRAAITNSINIVTVKTLQQIGVELGYEYAESFGFTTLVDEDKNLGLALGGLTNGVTNLELTAAYATIANGGTYIEPSFYTQVLDHDGNVILDNTETKESHRVVKETTAWLLTSAMEDVMTSGTGTRAYFGSTMAQAGKSGTTTSNRDALFAGFTPYYTCVVWGGYDDNSVQSGGNGTTYPKLLWNAVMSRIHEELPYEDFSMPAGITQVTVCAKSGDLVVDGVCTADPRGSMARTEYFEMGTEPTTYCTCHSAVTICTESGQVAGPYCPEECLQTQVYITSAEEGSGDYAYTLSDDFLSTTCTVHDGSGGSDEDGDSEENEEGEGDESEGDEGEASEENPESPGDDEGDGDGETGGGLDGLLDLNLDFSIFD
ncbi:MAG: transglycosylase domain-containing protein [Clostridiales bacterium]|nr:transglycosylase domain-containing protein [Clostridiales bacterium]